MRLILVNSARAQDAGTDSTIELGRGLAVLYRIEQIQSTWQGHAISGLDDFIEACAVRDMALVQARVDGARAGYTAITTDHHLIDIAEIAILQEDFDTLRLVTPEMAKRKTHPDMLSIFTGVLDLQLILGALLQGGLVLR